MILIRPSRCWLLALLSSVLCCAAVADNPTPPPSTEKSGLTGHRFLTLNTVVRVRQIEVTRDIAHGPDESSVHTPAEVRTFRETIDKAWPGSRITWAFSWLGLHDTRYGGRNGMDGLHLWLTEIRNRWPDAKLITQGEFGELWRTHFKNNEKLDYRFLHRGCGIRASQEDLEIRWFMNPDFRLSLLGNWKENSTPNVIDFTRYDHLARNRTTPNSANTRATGV